MQSIATCIGFALILFPMSAAAAAPNNLQELLNIFTNLIGIVVGILFTLIFFTIVWGVIRTWIMGDPSGDAVQDGKHIVTVGIIALVITLSIWGITRIVATTFFG